MRDSVVRYVRHPNTDNLIGCVVAVKTNDGIKFGFSQCNPKDQFNRKKGREIAIQRALIGSSAVPSGVTVKLWILPRVEGTEIVQGEDGVFHAATTPYVSLKNPKCMTERNADLFTEVYERVQFIAAKAFAPKVAE